MRRVKGRRIRQVFDRNAIGEGERLVVFVGHFKNPQLESVKVGLSGL